MQHKPAPGDTRRPCRPQVRAKRCRSSLHRGTKSGIRARPACRASDRVALRGGDLHALQPTIARESRRRRDGRRRTDDGVQFCHDTANSEPHCVNHVTHAFDNVALAVPHRRGSDRSARELQLVLDGQSRILRRSSEQARAKACVLCDRQGPGRGSIHVAGPSSSGHRDAWTAGPLGAGNGGEAR